MNSQNAFKRADKLEARLKKRLEELEKEKIISAAAPVIVSGALVIPKGLLHQLTRQLLSAHDGQADRQTVQYAAMKAVMEIETALGFLPRDVSADKCGYDIELRIPDTQRQGDSLLRMIEVKGRRKDATTVTITKNEMLVARTMPQDFILALVEVDGDTTHTVYLKNLPFTAPSFGETCRTFDIAELVAHSEIL